MKKLVLFGAGRIGRAFIGQLFARSGYKVVFVDISAEVIDALNRRGEYDVVIKSPDRDEILHVTGVRGVHAANTESVAAELSGCDMAAVSVGQRGLSGVAAAIARGLRLRYDAPHRRPLDIILAENMRGAGEYVYGLLEECLEPEFPLKEMAGLIETSIGKMVPIMPASVKRRDPLLVFTEPYNTLILDRKAFLNPIPPVEGLAPKDNIGAWVDRKSYIHNFGHAAAAYTGHKANPEAVYLYEVLENPETAGFTRHAMAQSAAVLVEKYPGEFTLSELNRHIDDLLSRFRNRALGDTVFRVGCDLRRKLGRNDRILSPLIDAVGFGLPFGAISQVFLYGLGFRARGEDGRMMPDDEDFIARLENKGLEDTLHNVCGLHPLHDKAVCDIITGSCGNGTITSPEGTAKTAGM